jgi:hypothetical protein
VTKASLKKKEEKEQETMHLLCRKIGEVILPVVDQKDSDLALHALTQVIADIIWHIQPEEYQPQTIVDVFHMLAHRLEGISESHHLRRTSRH